MLRPMFGMGASEILVILVVALIFLGPEKLPEAASKISRGIRDIRKQTRELTSTIENDTEIGGAIRDIKSALRGDEPRPKPKLQSVPPGAPKKGAPPPIPEVKDEPPKVTLPESAGEEAAVAALADGDLEPAAEPDPAELVRPATGTVAKGKNEPS
jgi:sec-independent protein translocase protein TatB